MTTAAPPRAAGEPAKTREPWAERARRAWRFAGPGLATYLACRIAGFSALAFAARINDLTLSDAPFRWDGGWYLGVARDGYPSVVPPGQSTLGFFPLFPMAARALAAVTPLSTRAAMLTVDAVFGAVFAVVLWRLLLRLLPDDEARRGLAVIVFFPGAFILSMAYSEPVMLALVALCLLALVDERWVRAGVWGALATATRPNALALVVAGVVAAWLAYRRGQGWRPFLAPAITPVGFIAFMVFLTVRTGDAMAYFHAQRDGWNMRTDMGATTFRHLVDAMQHPTADFNKSQVAVGAVIVAALLVYAWRRLPPVLYAYGVAAVFFAVASSEYGARPRAILTAFPLLIPLARPLRDLSLSIWVALSTGLLVSLAWITATSLLLTP